MRKTLLLLSSILLIACGGATPYPTPWVITAPPGLPTSAYDILPAEAQRIIDAATATAAAGATQQAQATATEVSARATSTTGARLTQDALVVRQTESALQLTAGAGAALATNDAAERTATSVQIAALATPAAAAQAAAVRATATALARQEAAAERRQVSDEQIRVGGLLALLAVLLIVLLAFGLALVFGVSDMLSARAAVHLAAAERARAEAMQLWIFQHGGNVFRLNGGQWELMPTQPQIAAPANTEIPENPEMPAIREVPVRAHGEVVSTVQVGEPETPERERVLGLLKVAINRVGVDATVIPSANKLGIAPEERQRAIELLRPAGGIAYVMTTQGRSGRTTLSQPGYKTLGQLRDGIVRGDVLARPTAPLSPAAAVAQP